MTLRYILLFVFSCFQLAIGGVGCSESAKPAGGRVCCDPTTGNWLTNVARCDGNPLHDIIIGIPFAGFVNAATVAAANGELFGASDDVDIEYNRVCAEVYHGRSAYIRDEQIRKQDYYNGVYGISFYQFLCFVENSDENCTDGKDNDDDGFTDCDDIKCKGKAECKPKFNTQCVGCCGGDDAPPKGPKPLSPKLQKLLGKDFQPECCKDDQASGDKDQTKTPPPPTPCEKQDGEPIGVNSGYFTDSRVDIALPGRMVAAVVPYYHSQSDFMGPLGHGWSSVLSVRLLKLTDSTFTLRDMWGQREDFDKEGINTSQRFYSANLILEGDAASIRLDREHVFVFNQNDGTLRSIKDNRGGSVNLVYETSSGIYGSQAVVGSERRKYGIHGVSRYAIPQGHRATITQDFRVNRIEDGDDATRFLQVNWDTSGMVGSIQDPVGRKVSYQYDRTGNLTQVTFADGTARRYRWTDTNDIHRMTAFDAKAIRPSLLADTSILTRNEWDVIGRVTRQLHQGAEWNVARSNYTRTENKINSSLNRITWTRLSTVTRKEPDGLGGTRTTKREFKDELPPFIRTPSSGRLVS